MSSGEKSKEFHFNKNPLWDDELSYFNADNIKKEAIDSEENADETPTQSIDLDISAYSTPTQNFNHDNGAARLRKRVQNYFYLHMYGHERVDGVDSSEDEMLVPERIVKTKASKNICPTSKDNHNTSATHSTQEKVELPITKQLQVGETVMKDSIYSPESPDAESETGSDWPEVESETEKLEPLKVAPPKRPYKPRVKSNEPRKKRDKSLCYICGKVLANSRSLNLHIKSHVGPAWLHCKVCSKKFPSMEEREIHFKTNHDPNEKSIKCKYCEEYFATIYSRQKHVSRTHKELRFVCQFCGKKFVTKEKMLCHVGSIHDGRKNYICAVCGKAYSQKVTLNYHLRTHSDNTNPFRCGVCAITYTYKYTMLNHVKAKHTEDGKAPVKCCDKCLSGFLEEKFDSHECKLNFTVENVTSN